MLKRITAELRLRRGRELEEEPSLPLYQILREEYEQLQPGTPLPEPVWRLEGMGVLDADALARRVVAALPRADGSDGAVPDAAALLALTLTPAERAALSAYVAGDSPSMGPAEVRERLGRGVDALVEGPPLWRTPAFEGFRAGPFTHGLVNWFERAPARRTDEQRQRINRLLMEAAFPAELARGFDHQLRTILALHREREYAALALSGGGIRSATFALGVMQSLSRAGVLGAFRYLSTVSGGGYIGGWLSAWIAHAGPAVTADALRAGPESRLDGEPDPIRHLRAYSNYLSPRPGFLSADTWTLGATYIRNLLLNWLVLFPLLASAVTIPIIGWHTVARIVAGGDASWVRTLSTVLLPAGFVLGAFSVAYVHASRPDETRAEGMSRTASARVLRGQSAFLAYGLAPLMLCAIALTTAWVWLGGKPQAPLGWLPAPLRPWPIAFAVFGALMHLAGWLLSRLPVRLFGSKPPWHEAIAILVTGGLLGWAASFAATALHDLLRATHLGPLVVDGAALYAWLALPALVAFIMLCGFLYVGFSSRWGSDPEREWSARYSAWLLIPSIAWVGVAGIALVGPALARYAIDSGWLAGVLSGSGALSGVLVLILGRSSKTMATKQDKPADAKRTSRSDTMRGITLAVAAPVFAAFLFALLAIADRWLLRLADASLPDAVAGLALARPSPALAALLLVVLALAGITASAFVRVNKFSLHAMYRARLIRAYLGASRGRGERRPHPFTGFDDEDNLAMHRLWPREGEVELPMRPLHLVNVALNLVRGGNLAWQERKAESFTISPLHAGSLRLGYRRTRIPGDPRSASPDEPRILPLYGGGGDEGITLGTAITISGAAASPNMGYHSSPVVTFLMTLFNARLGWWLGNPGPAGDATYHLAHPRSALWPFVAEMFGLTDNEGKYVYLSDGGHFENLALYELVLRRCRFIVVSDAGCDPAHAFQDLGNAIRKIRVDLGIPIEFSESGFRDILPRSEKPSSGRYWAVGTIRYSCVDAAPGVASSEHDGVLLYVKPATYGKEPRDVYNYAQASPTFPHESTGDQFFSESQFESYRALGAYEAEQVLADPTVLAEVQAILGRDRGGTLVELIRSLRSSSGMPPGAVAPAPGSRRVSSPQSLAEPPRARASSA